MTIERFIVNDEILQLTLIHGFIGVFVAAQISLIIVALVVGLLSGRYWRDRTRSRKWKWHEKYSKISRKIPINCSTLFSTCANFFLGSAMSMSFELWMKGSRKSGNGWNKWDHNMYIKGEWGCLGGWKEALWSYEKWKSLFCFLTLCENRASERAREAILL